jgi:hypothetical protein
MLEPTGQGEHAIVSKQGARMFNAPYAGTPKWERLEVGRYLINHRD